MKSSETSREMRCAFRIAPVAPSGDALGYLNARAMRKIEALIESARQPSETEGATGESNKAVAVLPRGGR